MCGEKEEELRLLGAENTPDSVHVYFLLGFFSFIFSITCDLLLFLSVFIYFFRKVGEAVWISAENRVVIPPAAY